MASQLTEYRGSGLAGGMGIAALALGGLALANALIAKRDERRYPPRGRFVTVDGVRLHYLEAGSGPPVVVLHGNVSAADDALASGIFDRLAQNHRVVAFDRPGMGHSERPRGPDWTPEDQARLLAHAFAMLGIDRPVVIGHSYGTLVALALALDHPDAADGLVLMAGYYFPTKRLDALLAAPAAVPVVGDLLRHTVSPPFAKVMMPAVLKTLFAPRPVPDDLEETFPAALTTRPGQLRANAQDGVTLVPAAERMQHRYAGLRLPVAIIAGLEDRVVEQREQSGRLHRVIPHSTLHWVPDAGHMVHYAAPGLVVRSVDQLAAERAPAGS
ncbi:alpha/beta fold hydrolase [Azospirillum picis]|uniref:Pimeloyl-ACP methyl ester carboxylesterase n=1 Tax=Azospirillum picis TaxID=488438 RepID=A0ABU0MEH8_9PROT|nr:alpha/beta hydrolase [Azospirillum picis]MBP2298002.1 pimeloyl-ACP methyl ester carboxylesterase [Azospirillum picis]MDQ0531840.1 pimeloyl-ACP methyl ester carboxylesterase [Azospirillum picis]